MFVVSSPHDSPLHHSRANLCVCFSLSLRALFVSFSFVLLVCCSVRPSTPAQRPWCGVCVGVSLFLSYSLRSPLSLPVSLLFLFFLTFPKCAPPCVGPFIIVISSYLSSFASSLARSFTHIHIRHVRACLCSIPSLWLMIIPFYTPVLIVSSLSFSLSRYLCLFLIFQWLCGFSACVCVCVVGRARSPMRPHLPFVFSREPRDLFVLFVFCVLPRRLSPKMVAGPLPSLPPLVFASSFSFRFTHFLFRSLRCSSSIPHCGVFPSPPPVRHRHTLSCMCRCVL